MKNETRITRAASPTARKPTAAAFRPKKNSPNASSTAAMRPR
jgi:hypothetical protein